MGLAKCGGCSYWITGTLNFKIYEFQDDLRKNYECVSMNIWAPNCLGFCCT